MASIAGFSLVDFRFEDTDGHIVRWYNLLVDIDERKRAEEALIASEREARLIVDSIPAGIEVLSPTGEVEGVNKHVAMYFGKTAEELKLAGLTGLIHPEDLQRVRDTASHSTTTGVPYDAEHRFLGADGKYRWFNVRGLPLRDADGRILRWYALHIDIDDRSAPKRRSAAASAISSSSSTRFPALAWSARLDGTAEFFNQHYLDYMGLSARAGTGLGLDGRGPSRRPERAGCHVADHPGFRNARRGRSATASPRRRISVVPVPCQPIARWIRQHCQMVRGQHRHRGSQARRRSPSGQGA